MKKYFKNLSEFFSYIYIVKNLNKIMYLKKMFISFNVK